MVPTEDEAKDLIARGLWKNLLMMLVEEVIELILMRDKVYPGPVELIGEWREQIDKLREYLKALGMCSSYLIIAENKVTKAFMFKRDMIYETLYEEIEKPSPEFEKYF